MIEESQEAQYIPHGLEAGQKEKHPLEHHYKLILKDKNILEGIVTSNSMRRTVLFWRGIYLRFLLSTVVHQPITCVLRTTLKLF
jgi:hypothetical protein